MKNLSLLIRVMGLLLLSYGAYQWTSKYLNRIADEFPGQMDGKGSVPVAGTAQADNAIRFMIAGGLVFFVGLCMSASAKKPPVGVNPNTIQAASPSPENPPFSNATYCSKTNAPCVSPAAATVPAAPLLAPLSNDIRNKLRSIRAAPYVLALLCFLMPFVKLSCTANPSHKVEISGSQFLFGGDPPGGQGEKIKPDGWVVLASLTCLGALFLVLSERYCGTILVSLTAIAAVVIFLIRLSNSAQKEAHGAVKVEMGIGMIIFIICLVCGSILGFKMAQPCTKTVAQRPESDGRKAE